MSEQPDISPVEDGVEFPIKVVPGASRSRVVGFLGTVLKVAVAAPAQGGQANAMVVETLAACLGVRRAQVVIISGQTRPQKRVRVRGRSAAEARSRIAVAIAESAS